MERFKNTLGWIKAMRGTVLLLLLLVPLAMADLPQAPSNPDPNSIPDDGIQGATLMLFVSSTVPPDFSFDVSHTAQIGYNCSILLDDEEKISGLLVPKAETVTGFLSSVAQGPHELRASCHSTQNASKTLEAIEEVTVDSSSPVLELKMASAVSSPVPVKVSHTAQENWTCEVGVDEEIWSEGFNLTQDQEVEITFPNIPQGAHHMKGICDTPLGDVVQSTRSFTVVGSSLFSVTITGPGSTVEFANVTLTYEHDSSSTLLCAATIDDHEWGEDDPRWQDPNHIRYSLVEPGYEESQSFVGLDEGVHVARVVCENVAGSTNEALKTFEVEMDGTDNPGLGPTVSVQDGEIGPLEAFDVFGFGFVENDDVNLYFLGGGTTVINNTRADGEGNFTYTHQGLLGGDYILTAKAASNSSVRAAVSFSIEQPGLQDETQERERTGSREPVIGDAKPKETISTVENVKERTLPSTDIERPTSTSTTSSEEEEGSRFWLLILAVVVLLGGVMGTLVYQGRLDVRSLDGFNQSIKALFSQGSQETHSEILDFIRAEREKGYDDLTIRSSLIGNGWDKKSVDEAFDKAYR